MRERPIMFKGEMVRAILAGEKTQTRRPLKNAEGMHRIECDDDGNLEGVFGAHFDGAMMDFCRPLRCPYGLPGDRLWVRETWAHYHTVNSIRRSDARSFAEVSDGLAGYRADGHDSIEDFRRHIHLVSGCDLEHVEIRNDRWQSAMFMPRWASRLTLEILSVWVERIQSITIDDMNAEGIDLDGDGIGARAFDRAEHAKIGGVSIPDTPERMGFAALWDSLYARTPKAWAANPWVWVVEFRRVEESAR